MWVTKVTATLPKAQWFVFLLLTAAHVYCNVKAVRSIHVDAINRSRAKQLVQVWLRGEPIPSPTEMPRTEPLLFEERSKVPDIVLGASLCSLSHSNAAAVVTQLGEPVYAPYKAYHCLIHDGGLWNLKGKFPARKKTNTTYAWHVFLRKGCSPNDVLRAFFVAAIKRHRACNDVWSPSNMCVEEFMALLERKGWDVNVRVALNPGGHRLVWGDEAADVREWGKKD